MCYGQTCSGVASLLACLPSWCCPWCHRYMPTIRRRPQICSQMAFLPTVTCDPDGCSPNDGTDWWRIYAYKGDIVSIAFSGSMSNALGGVLAMVGKVITRCTMNQVLKLQPWGAAMTIHLERCRKLCHKLDMFTSKSKEKFLVQRWIRLHPSRLH